jgi:hypothetical protein
MMPTPTTDAMVTLLPQMKRLLVPVAMSVSAARHLAWYLNYQISGETRQQR